MFNLRNIILSLTETSPKASEKAEKDSKQFGSGLEKGPNLVGKDSLTPAQLQARKSAGVPDDAIGAPGGRWYSRDGKTYLGRTVDGKFQPKGEDDEKKATERGGIEVGSPDRSQQSRTRAAKDKEASLQSRTPKEKLVTAASSAASRISKKLGLDMERGGRSRDQMELQSSIIEKETPREQNPNSNASERDREIAHMPFDEYQSKYAKGVSDREIEALGKFNSKFPNRNPHAGAPVGIHTDGSGQRHVLLRVDKKEPQRWDK